MFNSVNPVLKSSTDGRQQNKKHPFWPIGSKIVTVIDDNIVQRLGISPATHICEQTLKDDCIILRISKINKEEETEV